MGIYGVYYSKDKALKFTVKAWRCKDYRQRCVGLTKVSSMVGPLRAPCENSYCIFDPHFLAERYIIYSCASRDAWEDVIQMGILRQDAVDLAVQGFDALKACLNLG